MVSSNLLLAVHSADLLLSVHSAVIQWNSIVHLLLHLDLLLRLADSKPLHTLSSVEDNFILCVLSDMACVDHLAHELCSDLVVVGSLLSLLHSSPEVGQLFHCFLLSHLLQNDILFVLGDLGLRASALGAHLQHVGALALGHYSKKNLRVFEVCSTYTILLSRL